MRPAIIATIVCCGLAPSALATPLNLVGSDPDVAAGGILINYNATTDLFTAVGSTTNASLPPQVNNLNGQFSLSATIDASGNISGPGSILVTGDIGSGQQTLFSSNLISAFGFGATDKFEFLFIQQAGVLASAGSLIGSILVDVNLAFPGGIPSFESSFNNAIFPGGPGIGNADTFVPTPSAAVLAGLGGLMATRRRRQV